MSIPQTILIREEAKYSFSPANKSGPALKPFLEGQTTRKIVLSRDSSLIGVIDNFSIYIYKSATFEKIYSFKLVTAERCEKIESDNKKLEEMITKIQLNNSPNTDAIMYKRRIEREYIQEIDISPNNRFLVSLNKFQNAEEPNLTIRDIVHDKIIFALIMKNFNTENWPFFKWLDFEGKSIFCYNEKNKLLFFNADDAPEKTTIFEPFLVFDASATEGESANKNTSFLLKSFSMSASNGRIALFLKSKNKECLSKVTVYNFPNFSRSIRSKRLSAGSVKFSWKEDGDSLLIKSSVNSTKTYYMISKLTLFNFSTNTIEERTIENKTKNANDITPKKIGKSLETAKRKKAKEIEVDDFAAKIMGQIQGAQIDQNLPVKIDCKNTFNIEIGNSTLHDCALSNKGDKFIVISYDPIRPKLFRTRDGKLLYDFKPFKCNKIIWSPNDRFAWIAGVINMSGNMYFWDMQKYKQIGTGQHQGARSYCWSSDSKFFITACLSPWRKVDNGYKIWSFSGKLLAQFNTETLYQCTFVAQKSAEKFSPEDLTKEEKDFLMKIQPGQQEKKTVNFRVPSKKKEWKKPQQKIFGLPSNRAKNSSAKQRGSKKKVVGASAPKIPSKNKSYRKTRDISKWEKLKNKGKPENGSTVEKDCNIKIPQDDENEKSEYRI